MFWENFVKLCNNNGVSPNGVCADLGFSTAIATKWKNGSEPRSTTLQLIASYFDVTVDYLLGKEQKEKPIAGNDRQNEDPLLNEAYELMKKLSPENQKQAYKYLEFLSSSSEKQ